MILWSKKIDAQGFKSILAIVPKFVVACSLAYAMNLSITSAFTVVAFLFLIFSISGSVARGFTHLLLSLAGVSVISSILFLLKYELDQPTSIFFSFVVLAVVISLRKANRHTPQNRGLMHFECISSLLLGASALFFHHLTNQTGAKLFGLLLPEDNAAWIHASAGFIRFDASANYVTSLDYGSRSLTSVFLGVVSVPTRLLSSETDPVLSLVNVTNAYVVLILVLMFMSASVCREIFQSGDAQGQFESAFRNGKYSLIGVLSAISVGKIFISAGHLSLILALTVIWVVVYHFQTSSYFIQKTMSSGNFGESNLLLLSALAVGLVWFPLIPVSALSIIGVLYFYVFKSIRFEINKQHVLSLPLFGNSVLLVLILLAAITQLRIPSGYSISTLINVGTGGTLTPNVMTLSAAIIGFLLVIEVCKHNINLCFLFALFPLGLLAYWLASMTQNPVGPGYSVEKFSLLISLIGLPLVVGFVFGRLESFNLSKPNVVLAPILITFSVLHSSWGINSFPRLGMVDKNSWTLNYLPTLLAQSTYSPASQILCLGSNDSSDMAAYNCSRFASALQYREFSNNNLARRWRSQILEANVDPSIFPVGTTDFKVPEQIATFLDNGGDLIVLLVPGPFWQIEQRVDRPWMQEIPWAKIKVIE
jgi:hypothetical protein